MLCPNCQQEFNSQDNTPRILIFCGHTFCQQCIENLLQESESLNQEQSNKKSIYCPECKTLNQVTDGVNSFPKNLVLLQVQAAPQQQQVQQQKSVPQPSQKPKEQQVKQQQSSEPNKQLCALHSKKLEAFCEKDLQVLCIDCILSDQHKSHEIISVQKAVEKQKQIMFEEVSQAQKTEEKLRFITGDIKRHISDIHSQADKNRKELSQIYNFVRELLTERETTLKRQISENLTKEEQDAQNRLQEISDFNQLINHLKGELVAQSQEVEIEILMKARGRTVVQQEVNGQKAREITAFQINQYASSCFSLQEIKRDQELAQISKIINPSYKGPAIGQTLQAPQSSLYSQTVSSKMKRGPNHALTSTALPQNTPPQTSTHSQQSLPHQPSLLKEDSKKSKVQNMKQKVSPHRQTQQAQPLTKSKKPAGVVVLDTQQQKTGKTQASKQKVQNSFNNVVSNHINLYNYNYPSNNANQMQDNSGEVFDGVMGDDVSSIYPLETNDCYFHNQELPHGYVKPIKRDESVGALNDLLESLNKSTGPECIPNEPNKNMGSSTASDTAGSNSDLQTPPIQDLKLKQKSNIETPKQKKINPWKAQQIAQNMNSLSGKKGGLRKDNSTSDLEVLNSIKEKISPSKQNQNSSFYNYEEVKQQEQQQQRTNSLQKYSSINQNSPNKIKVNNLLSEEYGQGIIGSAEQRKKGQDMFHLASLSQERAKRKQQKLGIFPDQQQTSPFKLNNLNLNQDTADKNKNTQGLMDLLHECTKNIDKIEFRHSSKKQQQQQQRQETQESPIKLQNNINTSKAAICIVDLSKREETDENVNIQLRVVNNEDNRDTIQENEEEEGTLSKNVPNMTSQKDASPFKMTQDRSDFQNTNNMSNYSSSPQKQENIKLIEMSQQNNQFRPSDTQNPSQQQLTQQDNFLQQSVSVDTSVSDPFRALCRVKEEFIFIFSGFNDQKLLTCEQYDIQRGTWKEISQISKARTKFSAVPISKSRILIFGGKQADGQRTGEIEEYNLKTNKFKILPFKLPKPRSGFASCVKREEGKIFFCGGNSGSVLKKFDCLDLKKGKWSRWPEMLQKRDELAVALGPDGKIYAIGGYGGGSSSSNQDDTNNKSVPSNCLRTAERFDFNTGQWEILPEMNEARRALATVALPDGIYAIGGYDGKQYLSTVEKFDLQKQQWVYVKSMNTSRCTLAAVVSTDCQYIYALGGFNGTSLDIVERYNTVTDEWEFITPMREKRFMHEAVCLMTH